MSCPAVDSLATDYEKMISKMTEAMGSSKTTVRIRPSKSSRSIFDIWPSVCNFFIPLSLVTAASGVELIKAPSETHESDADK